MAESYSDFAYVYDELMDETPYENWCDRIVKAIEQYGITKPVDRDSETKFSQSGDFESGDFEADASESDDFNMDDVSEEQLLESERNLVVDLGCGTGTLTEMLYDKGYDMIGIDASEEMLECAMEKREQSGAEILYLNQDMRELELYSTVGTVISVCDSVNYLTEDGDIDTTLNLVHNYLYPGGLFIFDFNTDYKYREVIGNTTIAENRDDCSFIWDNFYDPEEKINEYDLTVFVRTDGDMFRRFTETHYQRGFDMEFMAESLKNAGFEIIKMLDSDTENDADDKTERIFVIAKCIK